MIIVDKKASVVVSAVAMKKVKQLLGFKDNPAAQKWAVNSLKSAGYLSKTKEGHMFGFDKYYIFADTHKENQFKILDVILQVENDNPHTDETFNPKAEEEKLDEKRRMFSTKGRVNVLGHAVKEAMMDFPELETEMDAHDWVVKNVLKSEIIDEDSVSAYGRDAIMCQFENTVFIVKETEFGHTVVTVYKPKRTKSVAALVHNFLDEQLKRLKRQNATIEKKNNLRIAELELEKAEYKLKLVKSRSRSAKSAYQEKILEIDLEISQLQRQIFDAKREKTVMARNIVHYA